MKIPTAAEALASYQSKIKEEAESKAAAAARRKAEADKAWEEQSAEVERRIKEAIATGKEAVEVCVDVRFEGRMKAELGALGYVVHASGWRDGYNMFEPQRDLVVRLDRVSNG